MKPFFAADLETDPFRFGEDVTAFASAVSDGRTISLWWGKDCIPQLLNFLRNKRGIVYFHNGGRFDLHHILRYVTLREIDPYPRMINGRIVALKWRDIEFRDSYALVPKPLRSWNKDEMKIWKLKRMHREKYREEICSYLRGDGRYLHEMMSAMLERYAPKSFPLTLAGLTFKIMEKDFGIKVIHTSRSFDRKLRPYYFGGRVQFWKLGKIEGDFSILDINSAYPCAMMEEHFWGENYTQTKPRKNHVIDTHSFYRVRATHPRGAFPVRTPEGLGFPDSDGVYRVSGWELSAYVSACGREGLEICSLLRPRQTQSFRGYVKHFYDLKENAKDKAERYFAKLILNSFYGKLAQNDENYRETLIRPYRKWPKGKGWELVADHKASGVSIFQRPAPRYTDPFCVAAGASITGWVRAHLWAVIRANPGCLYCDTDSLIAPNPVAGCRVGTGLGNWKMEMRCDVVWVAGKKLYAAHNGKAPWLSVPPVRKGWIHVVGKGYTPLDAETWEKFDGTKEDPWKSASKGVRLNVADIIAVAEGHARTYKQDAPTYSLGKDPTFITRTVRRADKRK